MSFKEEYAQAATPLRSRILIIDADLNTVEVISNHLVATNNYEIRVAAGGQEGLAQFEQEQADLIILELVLPDFSGLKIIKEVRQHLQSEVPIIVISTLGEEWQKVEALDLGATDYLMKPFGIDELMARVRVALRYKSGTFAPTSRSGFGDNQFIGNWQLNIDLTHHRVLREGRELKLTPKQYELLKYLALNSEKLLPHRVLLQNVWGNDYIGQIQYLHVFIGQLRQKIEPNPARPRFIITEPGLGYRFKLSSLNGPKSESNLP